MALEDILKEHSLELPIPEEWYKTNPKVEDSIYTFLTKKIKIRLRIGCGYYDQDGYAIPSVPVLVELINLMIAVRYQKQRTYREALELIPDIISKDSRCDASLTSPGSLSIFFSKIETSFGLVQKETTADRLKRIRQDRLAKNGGKKVINYSRDIQKKQALSKDLTETNKELKQVKAKERALKNRIVKKAKELNVSRNPTHYNEALENSIDNVFDTVKNKIVECNRKIHILKSNNLVERYTEGLRTNLSEKILMEMYREIMDKKEKFNKRSIAFLPTPRQYQFLSAPEDIVLYGGAAGGGKSYSMVIDPLRYAHIKAHNAVIIRKTMPELNELIDTSRELYPVAFPGARYKETDHVWTFPSGAHIRFGHLDRPADKYKYQGKAYSYIGFDELSQHQTDEGFRYLQSRLRRTNKEIQPYIRATANPGSQWVYDLFIAPTEPGQPFIMKGTENNSRPLTMRFIPARLEDNPHLDEDGLYRSMLEGLPDVERRQLLDGDWLASNDAMFPEFNILEHVVEPFYVPPHWNRIAGLDYGYRDPSASVWFAVDPEDGSLVVYDEFLQTGLTGREFALAIQDKEKEELVYVEHPIDWSVFARTGHSGPTIAESMLSVPGFRMKRADKNREAGWVQIHEHLRKDPKTGMPKIRVFSSCKQLIRQLISSKVHKNKPNDLDDSRNTDGHWDLLDALRYGIMSRPRLETFETRQVRYKQHNRWEDINNYFS